MKLPYMEILDDINFFKFDYFEYEGDWRDWEVLVIADGQREHLRFYLDGYKRNSGYSCDFIISYDEFKRMSYADYNLYVSKQVLYNSYDRSTITEE